MKAEERHKMKSNELAESLEHVPDYLRAHGPRLLTGAVVVLVVLVGGWWWLSARAEADHRRHDALHGLLMDGEKAQMTAALRSAQLSNEGDADMGLPPNSYDGADLAKAWEELAAEAPGTGLAGTALLNQAEALRGQLLYSDQPSSAAQREEICGEVEALYMRVIAEHQSEGVLSGAAQLGLGLIAEERRQWDKAREAYEKLTADSEAAWAGTVYPGQARKRLAKLDELKQPVEFGEAPAVTEPEAAEPIDEILPPLEDF